MEQQEDQKLNSVEAEVDGDSHSDDDEDEEEVKKLAQTLEQRTLWDSRTVINYRGYWCPVSFFRTILSVRKQFQANAGDVIVASMPKSGTTWLKALTFTIANRQLYPIHRSPLLTSNPHKLVPFMELNPCYLQENPHSESPRILSTHLSFKTLPRSILDSECRIVYICRNPLDLFVSIHHFLDENKPAWNGATPPLDLAEGFDMFCRGIHYFGPFWKQMLEYWAAHLENPRRVLFLKYEDLRGDVGFYVRKIGEFLGCPFSAEEEEQGLVEAVASLYSFDNLSSLEVNKSGAGDNIVGFNTAFKNSSFFRKGQVGDWVNYLTPAMAQRIRNLMEIEFQGSGLTFNVS